MLVKRRGLEGKFDLQQGGNDVESEDFSSG